MPARLVLAYSGEPGEPGENAGQRGDPVAAAQGHQTHRGCRPRCGSAATLAAPLLLAGTTAVLFGVLERGSLLQLVLGIPIALWEFSLGVYLTVRGFRPEAVDRLLASR